MAMRLMTREEFEKELSDRGCRKLMEIGATGYTLWEDHNGEPFSVPPPEELTQGGEERYPDWMLDDLINSVGLAEKGPHTH
jgi:hypothetical protein